jgi:hypothetical protein
VVRQRADSETLIYRARRTTAQKSKTKKQESEMVDKNSDGLDGFDGGNDGGGNSIIQGSKLKFSKEGEWLIGEDVVAADREFVVVEGIKVYQKWIDQRPVETHRLAMHEQLPDIDALNNAAPREEWVEKFGRDVGPWDWSYVLYLMDLKTAQVFTYVTNTAGGGQAVRALRQSVGMARRMYGDNVYPKVLLRDVFMNTKFGGRQAPSFDIIGYETLGPSHGQIGQTVDPHNPPLAGGAEQKLIEAAPANPSPAINGNGAADSQPQAPEPKAPEQTTKTAMAAKAKTATSKTAAAKPRSRY